jgi:uroporphyrin-III C-methyltransferase
VSVFLVGAGPGDADLLTLRAARLLGEADVIVRDRLIDDSVMAYANPNAEVIDVGKMPGDSSSQTAINELLVSLGQRFGTVVRLKGGDPFIFGRGGEELLALHAAGIACDVVPGVTSALSAPLAAGISVTHRGTTRGVSVVTGTDAAGGPVDVRALAATQTTIVVLMGIRHRHHISADLIAGGLDQSTPVAVIERAWTSTQRTVRGDLLSLPDMDVTNPAVIVVGDVAALDLRAMAPWADVVLV